MKCCAWGPFLASSVRQILMMVRDPNKVKMGWKLNRSLSEGLATDPQAEEEHSPLGVQDGRSGARLVPRGQRGQSQGSFQA